MESCSAAQKTQFEERLVDTSEVTHPQEAPMPNFITIPHLSARARAMLASLSARQQLARGSVDFHRNQPPAPGPTQQPPPLPTPTQRCSVTSSSPIAMN